MYKFISNKSKGYISFNTEGSISKTDTVEPKISASISNSIFVSSPKIIKEIIKNDDMDICCKPCTIL